MEKDIKRYITENSIYCFVCTSKTTEAKAKIQNILKEYKDGDKCSIEVLLDGDYEPEETIPMCSGGFWPSYFGVNIDIIKLKIEDQYIDIKKFLEDNGENIPSDISAGAYWDGYMDYEGSYYAEELGYDNPEEYDDCEEQYDIFQEWLAEKAGVALDKNLFASVSYMKE